MRGSFIVLEGLDRSGKSSQCEKLVETLEKEGIKTVALRFPDRSTTTGKMINEYLSNESTLDDHVVHLLFSANRWEKKAYISEILAAGTTIIADRYAFSGIAFSAAKGLDYDWCRAPDVGLPAPDLVLFLDLDLATAASRGGYGTERYEKPEFQEIVRSLFTDKVGSDATQHGIKWHTVDARKPFDEVSKDILSTTLNCIHSEKKETVPSLFV